MTKICFMKVSDAQRYFRVERVQPNGNGPCKVGLFSEVAQVGNHSTHIPRHQNQDLKVSYAQDDRAKTHLIYIIIID